MNYEPKVGDVVNWTSMDTNGVVLEIYDNKECLVHFKDWAEIRVFTDGLTLISRPEPFPETALRDHFAGLAMAAMVGNVRESFKFEKKGTPGAITQTTRHFPMDEIILEGTDPDDNTGCYDRDISISAYRIADAMLAARGGK